MDLQIWRKFSEVCFAQVLLCALPSSKSTVEGENAEQVWVNAGRVLMGFLGSTDGVSSSREDTWKSHTVNPGDLEATFSWFSVMRRDAVGSNSVFLKILHSGPEVESKGLRASKPGVSLNSKSVKAVEKAAFQQLEITCQVHK